MADETPLLFVPVGDNPARPFGMDAKNRACRLATNAGFESVGEPVAGRAVLLASMDYGWDPLWLKEMRGRPGSVLTLGGKPVLAHVPAEMDAAPIVATIASSKRPTPTVIPAPILTNSEASALGS